MGNIAIITARSGSKSLPDKNIKELCGKPLIAYSIECALESGQFDKVFVSTDSEKYAEIAKLFGAALASRSILPCGAIHWERICAWIISGRGISVTDDRSFRHITGLTDRYF